MKLQSDSLMWRLFDRINTVIGEIAFLQWIGIFLCAASISRWSVVGITRIYFMFIDGLQRYKQHCVLLFHPKTKPFESDMYIMFSVPYVIALR